MPAVLLVALTAVTAIAAFRFPLRVGLPALVAALVLLPAPLVVPNGISPLPTLDRVLLAAVALGLVVHHWRGELASPGLKPGPLHAGLAALLLVGAAAGIGLGLPAASLNVAFTSWLGWFEQAAFFVVVLACLRLHDDLGRLLRIVAVVLSISMVIAALEQLMGDAFGRWLFSRLPGQQATDAATRLSQRGSQLRVRAGSEFALEFAWVSLALLPAALLGALRWAASARQLGGWLRRRPVVVPGLLALAVSLGIYWSVSRSAMVLLVPVLVLAALAVRDRRLVPLPAGAIVLGALTWLLRPTVLDDLRVAADRGAIDVRGERLPQILHHAAEEPVLGLGLGSLRALGFPSTDSSYLLTYAELGVLGLAIFGMVLLFAHVSVGRALVGADHPDRRVAGAAAVGMLTLLVGAVVFDVFHVLGSARVFWLLTAVGLVASERLGRALVWPQGARRLRLAIPAAGLVAGTVVAATWAPLHTVSFRFLAVPVTDEVAPFDPVTHGETLVNTVCGAVEARLATLDDVDATCVDLHRAAGEGRLRLESEDGGALRDAGFALLATIREDAGIGTVRLHEEHPVRIARPTPARTAPLWLGLAGLGMAACVPSRRGVREELTR